MKFLSANRAAPPLHRGSDKLQNHSSRGDWRLWSRGNLSPGHFRSVNSFRTERDAQDWIEQQQANELAAGRILQT